MIRNFVERYGLVTVGIIYTAILLALLILSRIAGPDLIRRDIPPRIKTLGENI